MYFFSRAQIVGLSLLFILGCKSADSSALLDDGTEVDVVANCTPAASMEPSGQDGGFLRADLPCFQNVAFDQLVSSLARAANLKDLATEGWSALFNHEATFHLYRRTLILNRSRGDARSWYRGSFYELSNDGYDAAKKTIKVGGIDGTQGYWNTSYIEIVFQAIEYKRQGESRGQYGTAMRFLKDKTTGGTSVIGNIDELNAQRMTPVQSLRVTNNSIEVVMKERVHTSDAPIEKKFVITLNETLDMELFHKIDGRFEKRAYYTGGYKVQPGDRI